MFEEIKTGSPFTWTLKSPGKTKHDSKEFDSFVDDHIILVRNDSHIMGDVIYNDGQIAIIEVKEMTPNLFPFTLFYNEVENNFPNFSFQNDDPYKKFFCIDIASMTSLFYYDMGMGYLAESFYDEEGDFVDYDLPDLNDNTCIEPEVTDFEIAEQLSIQLKESEIEEFEDHEVFRRSDEIDEMAETEDGNFALLPDNFSVNRAGVLV